MINIHHAVMLKLEDEKIYLNLIEILTDRVFCGGGNPDQFRKVILDELAGKWGTSMWNEGIPDVLTKKIDNMADEMEIKYHQLMSAQKQHRFQKK